MPESPLFGRVRKTVKKYRLLERGDRILVAFSGGGDSVFLLHSLLRLKEEYKLELALAHYHHGMRGKEADRDLEFAKRVARENSIPIFLGMREEKGKASETHLRMLRLRFLEEKLKEWRGDKIATGHTFTDCLETAFLNILRGTGIKGLIGIQPKRGFWIRPLIELKREEIREYLENSGITYMEDRTNLEISTPRNFLRNRVFPLLREKFGEFEWRLGRGIEILRETEETLRFFIEREVENLKKHAFSGVLRLDREEFLKLPLGVRKALIHHLFQLNYDETEEVIKVIESGGERRLPDGRWLDASFSDVVVVTHPLVGFKDTELKEGKNNLDEINVIVEISLSERPREGEFTRSFSLGSIKKPIRVRPWKEGDRIRVKGRDKKLKEIFSEKKVSRWMRKIIPVFVDGEGILWVPNLAIRDGTGGVPPYLIISLRRQRDGEYSILDR
jgi:tRNA(Ile)-lysidine synthase